MKAVSFSLWGDREAMYHVGAIRNAELMPTIYPGWKAVVYAYDTVSKNVIESLRKLGVDVRKPTVNNGMFARFAIADDPNVEAFIIRDTDSRIGPREAGAVKEWLESGKAAHVIADHPHHTPIMGGGLFGLRHGAIKGIQKLMDACPASKMESDRRTNYNSDQLWLRDVIWPMIQKDVLIHDLCYHSKRVGAVPFPSKFGDDRFVGEVFDAQDRPRAFDSDMRINFQEPHERHLHQHSSFR